MTIVAGKRQPKIVWHSSHWEVGSMFPALGSGWTLRLLWLIKYSRSDIMLTGIVLKELAASTFHLWECNIPSVWPICHEVVWESQVTWLTPCLGAPSTATAELPSESKNQLSTMTMSHFGCPAHLSLCMTASSADIWLPAHGAPYIGEVSPINQPMEPWKVMRTLLF